MALGRADTRRSAEKGWALPEDLKVSKSFPQCPRSGMLLTSLSFG